LPGQLQFFVVGMALYMYGRKLRVPSAVTALIAVAFLVAWTWWVPIPPGLRPLIVAAFVYSLAFCMPVIPLRTDISYSVYLVHGPLIQTLLLLGLFQDTMPCLAAILIAVLLLSLVTERLVERPGNALGHRLSRPVGRPARAVSPAV
jgi:peptidoglycan/LPS O-acetylase OafA/YrhL